MSLTRTLALALAFAAGGALTACGDDGGSASPDAKPIDAHDIDAPPEATFTSYVLDLVLHQTADDSDPRPFAEFSSLADPDADNENAYEALFP